MAGFFEEIRRKSRKSPIYRGQLLVGLLFSACLLAGFTEALVVTGILFLVLLSIGLLSGRSKPRMLLWEDMMGDFPRGDWKLLYADFYYIRPHVMRVLLLNNGISAFITDEFMGSMRWNSARAVGGVKLWVPHGQFEMARELLLRLDSGATCPDCGYTACEYQPMNAALTIGSAVLLNVMIPFPQGSWKCFRCGHRWKQKPEPEQDFA